MEKNFNELFQTVEDEIFSIIKETGNCDIWFADPFLYDISLFLSDDKITEFFEKLNKKYHTNFPRYQELQLWQIYEKIVRTDLLNYFEKNLESDLEQSIIDLDLFKIYSDFDSTKDFIKNHILEILRNGHFQYLKGNFFSEHEKQYTIIQSSSLPDSINTTLIIQGNKLGKGYKLVDVFPGRTCFMSKQKTTKGMISYCSEHLGWLTDKKTEVVFINKYYKPQFYNFTEGKTENYLFYGIAYNKNDGLDSSLYNFKKAMFFPLENKKICLENPEEFYIHNTQFYVIWTDSVSGVFMPVYISEKILPKDFDIKNSKEIELQVLVCGLIHNDIME